MIFPHDSPTHSHTFREGTDDDDYYTRNDMFHFKARYHKRIANLRANIHASAAVKLIYNRCPDESIDTMDLRSCFNNDPDNLQKVNDEANNIAWAFRGSYPGSHDIHVVPVAFDAPHGFSFR